MTKPLIVWMDDDHALLAKPCEMLEAAGFATCLLRMSELGRLEGLLAREHPVLCLLELLPEPAGDESACALEPETAFQILDLLQRHGVYGHVFARRGTQIHTAQEWLDPDYQVRADSKSMTLDSPKWLSECFVPYIRELVAEAEWIMEAEGYDPDGRWVPP